MKKFKITPAHIKFCEHYAEYGNATQAYLFAFPKVTYGTAKTEGSELLTNPDIKERIDRLVEEFQTQFRQDKDKTIRDLFITAEQAKAAGNFVAYAKLREMIIKIKGFYEPEKMEHSGNVGMDIRIISPEEDGNTEA